MHQMAPSHLMHVKQHFYVSVCADTYRGQEGKGRACNRSRRLLSSRALVEPCLPLEGELVAILTSHSYLLRANKIPCQKADKSPQESGAVYSIGINYFLGYLNEFSLSTSNFQSTNSPIILNDFKSICLFLKDLLFLFRCSSSLIIS